jgi:hypothetical protein
VDRDMLSESELDYRLDKNNPVNRAALDDEDVPAALASVRHSVESGAHREAPTHSSTDTVTRTPSSRDAVEKADTPGASPAVASRGG